MFDKYTNKSSFKEALLSFKKNVTLIIKKPPQLGEYQFMKAT